MRIYKDREKAKSYFYYYGWTILVFIVAFFLTFFLIFQNIFAVKRTQRIDMFIAAQGLKDYEYSTIVEKKFKSAGLIEMNIYSYLEDDINLFDYFSANGEKADFVIFSETNCNDLQEYLPANYKPLSSIEDTVESVKSFETYKYDGVSYGIKIFDGANEAYNNKYKFKDFIEFTKEGKENESYYLLIDNESPNFDKENKHTLGYSVLSFFLYDMTI
ncbi:MAG: hypothetical protein J5511_02755 [Bacilli bacterium]|nr:hypothetical protein [Bacilli bacterium]